MAEQELTGGNSGPVHRIGDEVLRPAGVWTPAVHRLLEVLVSAGVPGVPTPRGLTDDGRERVGFVPGIVPQYPMPRWIWDERVLVDAALLLRRLHDATADRLEELPGPWRSATREPVEVIRHHDFAPYNLVFDDGRLAGVIDFDFAAPGPRLWDLAYLAYRLVPLSGAEDVGDGFDEQTRLGRLSVLFEAYGLPLDRDDLAAMLVEVLTGLAAHSAANGLSAHADLYRLDAEQLAQGRFGPT